MLRRYITTKFQHTPMQLVHLRASSIAVGKGFRSPNCHCGVPTAAPSSRDFLGTWPLIRHYTNPPASDKASDPRFKKLERNPSQVTTTSSIRPIVEKSQANDLDAKQDILKGGVQHDLSVIRETFAFREVPKEVLFFGGAGLVPYIGTTTSTLFLAWDIRNMTEEGVGYLVDLNTASTILSLLEPIQVGFGAVILSFLGAIHWGLEFAAFGGNSPYRRYFLGILAPALAWPTVFMQYDIALLTQFLGFTGMYFADSQATTLGLAPKWYTTYRFLLTFVVGACIVMTLISRGKINEKKYISGAFQDRVHKLREGEGLEPSSAEYRQLVRQDQEEVQRRAQEAKVHAEQELAQKKTEYLDAKEAVVRAARKLA